jgi:hypothetical protein
MRLNLHFSVPSAFAAVFSLSPLLEINTQIAHSGIGLRCQRNTHLFRRGRLRSAMLEFCNKLVAVLRAPPADVTPCVSQANSYREVISLQAVFVTLTVALLAYIQRDPTFDVKTDLMFAMLTAVPIIGLFHIVRGRVRTPQGEVYVCTQPVRRYARQAFLLDMLIVATVSYLYWQGLLPGQ